MSLKARLLLLYASLTTGAIVVFSVGVSVFVEVTLLRQVDQILAETAKNVVASIKVNSLGRMHVPSNMPVAASVVVQIWDSDQKQVNYTPGDELRRQPMDPLGKQTTTPIFRDVFLAATESEPAAHMRVLSVPIIPAANVERSLGVLQVGINLSLIDRALSELYRVTFFTAGAAVVVLIVVGYFALQVLFRPLEAVRQAAMEITETNDLSRRIPAEGNPEDEIGQLVTAFNLNLSRLERLLDTQKRFLADVGHELRTPLTVIKGNVALMRRFGELDEESLTSIVQEVDRMTRLVEDLLLLAQAEAGKLPMARQEVDFDALVLEVLQEARVLAGSKVKLTVATFDQVQVCGDRDRLKQVVINLVSNGIKYTPRGGEVRIALAREDAQAVLQIQDTGPGIPAEELPHIFERFYRGEKSRKRSRDGGGFGLGLSIAYWIVRNHDGEITVNSEVGKGTVFVVHLPLISESHPCQSDFSRGQI